MIKSEVAKSLKTLLKNNGYSTHRTYWLKESIDVMQFMNIQGSLWDANDVNVGIMKKTHMQPEPDKIVKFVLETHREMSSVNAINLIYNEGKFPKYCFRYWDKEQVN